MLRTGVGLRAPQEGGSACSTRRSLCELRTEGWARSEAGAVNLAQCRGELHVRVVKEANLDLKRPW